MPELGFRSASELLRALRQREISSRELLEHYLARVEAWNPALRAVVTLDEGRARRRADEADAALARGEARGPLHGLPISVKDCFETKGLRTTAGSRRLAEHVPTSDAVAVARLEAAGAILFAKTNTPSLAMDWQTYNPLFGTTCNPWDVSRTPGGSSGGSAAAIAAGLSGLELASDIGGSIRVPAGWCGIFGHKPSWGIVPQRGHIPGWPGSLREEDINVIGPLARSAEDLALALRVLAGPLPDRALGWKLELPPPRREALREFRVAAWLDDPAGPVDAAVRERLEAAVAALRGAGVVVDEQARPGFSLQQAVELYRNLMIPITGAVMGDAEFQAIYKHAEAAAPDDPSELMRSLRSVGLRHRDWLLLIEERERQRALWADFFRRFDVLLCPVAPVAALRHDHGEPMLLRRLEVNGEARPYTDLFAWPGLVGVAHLPASVAPVGRTRAGLPVGIQIVAPYLEDQTSIAFAAQLERLLGGFEPPAGPPKLG
ncbi:MAG TPA: amidase [Myxococcota bacterium]|jgi:amidase